MTPSLALVAAPACATGVLLLAAHRVWLWRRAWVEGVGFVAALGAFAALLAPLPPVIVRAAAPFAVFAAFWLGAAVAAWRFAPDRGQSGFGWAAGDPLPVAVPVGLALALVHATLATATLPALIHVSLLGAAAFAAHAAFPRPRWP